MPSGDTAVPVRSEILVLILIMTWPLAFICGKTSKIIPTVTVAGFAALLMGLATVTSRSERHSTRQASTTASACALRATWSPPKSLIKEPSSGATGAVMRKNAKLCSLVCPQHGGPLPAPRTWIHCWESRGTQRRPISDPSLDYSHLPQTTKAIPPTVITWHRSIFRRATDDHQRIR